MSDSVSEPIDMIRQAILDRDGLVRAIGSGRRRGGTPRWRRVEVRYVDLKGGRRLQITAYDRTQAHTLNHDLAAAPGVVEELLAEPFGNWHVDTGSQTYQLRFTKGGRALLHTAPRRSGVDGGARPHDREKPRLLPEDDPVLAAIGIADANGRVKPSRQAKYRQVDEFLRALIAAIDDARATEHLRTPTAEDPWRIVDLGCGNAYLTFAAHRYLAGVLGVPVRLLGVDTKAQVRERNAAIAEALGVADEVSFEQASIGSVEVDRPPDIVLALHACDTATDDALARAIGWEARLILAAPCCHRDVAKQLRSGPAPFPSLTRDGILRERFADTLTDAMRAAILRTEGYRVDVIEFVESKHTPRNTLLRAVRTGATPSSAAAEELEALTSTWHVLPKLAVLLGR
ncbi:MAG TPA: SAM-dependent methyltransferase [Actinomycetota bacterium]